MSRCTLGQYESLYCPGALFCHRASLSPLIPVRHFWHFPNGCWDTRCRHACFASIHPQLMWQRGKDLPPSSLWLFFRWANSHVTCPWRGLLQKCLRPALKTELKCTMFTRNAHRDHDKWHWILQVGRNNSHKMKETSESAERSQQKPNRWIWDSAKQ